jgi:hypothetical protein
MTAMNNPTQPPSKKWSTPWCASGFAVYAACGELVAHTGICGNHFKPEQNEVIARLIADAVNAYSVNEPLERLQRPFTPEEAKAYRAFIEDHFEPASAQPPPVDQDDDARARDVIESLRDALRYRRLQILGVAPYGSTELKLGLVMRFTNLDNFVDADIKAHPSRGEYSTATKGEGQ